MKRTGSLIGLAALGGLGLAAYAGYVAQTWLRYGSPSARSDDSLLDRFMPEYEVRQLHRIRVNASAEASFAAIQELDFEQSFIIQSIFKARALLLGENYKREPTPHKPLIAALQSLGWQLLGESRGEEVVLGGATKPWEATPVFKGIPSEQFKAFADPDYVKIVFGFRVESLGPAASVVTTETRALATDENARRRFRTYWAFLSPGMYLIRRILLGEVKARAAGIRPKGTGPVAEKRDHAEVVA